MNYLSDDAAVIKMHTFQSLHNSRFTLYSKTWNFFSVFWYVFMGGKKKCFVLNTIHKPSASLNQKDLLKRFCLTKHTVSKPTRMSPHPTSNTDCSMTTEIHALSESSGLPMLSGSPFSIPPSSTPTEASLRNTLMIIEAALAIVSQVPEASNMAVRFAELQRAERYGDLDEFRQ
jgi:hypothetical protein